MAKRARFDLRLISGRVRLSGVLGGMEGRFFFCFWAFCERSDGRGGLIAARK